MKRIPGLFRILTLAGLLPFLTASGQDKKNEQKIKIVIADDSGTRTVMDTTFTGDKMPETITLENGKVIHLSKHGADVEDNDTDSKGNQVFVTVSSDSEGDNTAKKHIIIASSGDKPHEWQVEKSVTISDGDVIKHEGGKSFSVVVSDNDEQSDSDATKYIIAKDGVVVTIQSDDEAKAMELKKVIESKLGVDNDKEAAKTGTKKTEKK
jgi:hypothetical protein